MISFPAVAALSAQFAGTPLGLNAGAAAAKASARIDPVADAKLKRAAGEFEGQLLAALWKSMKTSFADSDAEAADPASQSLQDWGIDSMSQAVGKAGGLGIGRLIVKELEARMTQPEIEKTPNSK